MSLTIRKNYIILIADGRKDIGLGHLKRTSIIAKYFNNKKGIFSILLTESDRNCNKIVKSNFTNFILLKNKISFEEKINILSELNSKYKPLFVLLDVLENDLNFSFFHYLKEINVPLVMITDDSNKMDIEATLVLNGNPNQLGVVYRNPNKYLLGPKYFIMDTCYEDIKSSKPLEKKNNHILISLGGSDHNDIIFKTIKAIILIDEISEITIISSRATGYSSKLKDFINREKKKINLLFDVPSLAPYFLSSDIAITAGGNTLFERIATRLPGATICQLKRQMEIADKFEELGVNINFGYGPGLTVEEIYTNTRRFIKNHSMHVLQYELSKNIIDGKGLNRFVNKITQIINLG